MERLKSVGQTIDEILATKQPSPEELRKVEPELARLGGDPTKAIIVWAARQIPITHEDVFGEKRMAQLD